MKHRILIAALASYLLTSPLPTFAAPPLINYQGRVVVGSTNFEGTGQFKFALVDGGVNQNVQATAFIAGGTGSITFIHVGIGGSGYVAAPAVTITDATGTGATAVATVTGGAVTSIQVTNGGSGYSPMPTVTIAPPPPNIFTTAFWNNAGTVVGVAPATEPATAVSLPVIKGLYSALLGDTNLANMAAIPTGVFAQPDLRLRVWFNDGVNGFQLLSPDQRFAPAAYLADGAVTSTTIADAAITSEKVAVGAITGTQLASGTIDATRLATPGSPSAGQVLGYNAGSLAWIAGGPFSLNGTNAFYNGGNVGIGTDSPAHRLSIAGGPGWTDNGWLGSVALANASAIGWGSGGGTKSFGMGYSGDVFFLFHTTSTPGFVGSPAVYDLAINGSGNVGIGTIAPGSKLDVVAQDAVRVTGFQPFMTFRDSNAGNARGRIQSMAGGLTFETESFVSGSNGNAFASLAASGDFSVKTLTIRGGADLAEPFEMKEEELAKGSVVVIDAEHPGRLKRSAVAYDTRVAGIISGANGVNPGIALHQEGVLEGGQNVALSGRVYVRADATGAPIKPGDLLTTSDTPGHAMKVMEPTRAQGAVIGKAMSSLDSGTGMVLVLVTLQ